MNREQVSVFWYCEKWQVGGIQKIQMNLMKRMDPNRVAFTIAISEDDTAIFDDAIRAAGASKLVTLRRTYHSPMLRVAANFFSVGRHLSCHRYDVVHFNVCHGVELAYVFWAWLYRVPVRIVHCRNNDVGAGGKTRPIKLMAHAVCKRLFAKCANIRLANSKLAAEWLYTRRELRRGCVRLMNNGIESDRFAFSAQARAKMRAAMGLEDAFVVGHVGHFSYQKNHEFLLRIFAALVQTVPNAVLLLVGEGDGEPEVRAQAEQLGIFRNVVFYGVSDDVAPLMSAMDVFLLPSRFEGFGNVLVEAQASGLWCFASKDVIPAEVAVTGQFTWISLEEPPEAWARQIAALSAGYARQSGVEAVKAAGYDICAMAEEMDRLYHEGLGAV